MSRDWLAVYASTLTRPKYRRLSIPGRAGLLHLWMLAGGETPEATWPTLATLADLFDLDNYPPEIVPELVDRGWIDVDEDGRVWVHDWDQWQLAATQAARRAYEAARKAAWRRPGKATAPDPVPPLSALSSPTGPDKTGTTHNRTDVPKRPGPVRDTDGTCPGCGDLVKPRDENVAADRHGRLWHQACPAQAVAF